MSKENEKVITIETATPNPTVDPIVVSFPGGLPQGLREAGADAGDSGAVKPKFFWQKLNSRSTLGRRVVGSDHCCTYSGQCKGFSYDDRRTKLCVGVYDKKRGVLTLHEAASKGTVFAMSQAIPSYQETIQTQSIEMTALGRRAALFEDFGSSKKRKVLKSQSANMVEIDHIVGAGKGSAVVDAVLKGQSMSESNRAAIKNQREGAAKNGLTGVEAAHEQARRNFLPEYNQEADKPHLVYSAMKIAGDEAWSKLSSTVDECLRQSDFVSAIRKGSRPGDWNPSAVQAIKQIPRDKRSTKERLVCSVLLNWITTFYSTCSTRRSIKPPDASHSSYFGIPVEVALRCIELFTTSIPNERGTVYSMSKSNKEKCVVHALILFVMGHGGTTMRVRDIGPIVNDLKAKQKEASQMLRLAGFKVGNSRGATSATLEVPLTFPPPQKGVRGGK